MFESNARLAEDASGLLGGLRRVSEGRYACVLTREKLVFESHDAEADVADLRQRLCERAAALFALPRALEGEGPEQDAFEGFETDGFLLNVINARVAVVLVCPDPEAARAAIDRPLKVLVDRLFRYDASWRLDSEGRGLFLGRPKMEVVVVGRGEEG